MVWWFYLVLVAILPTCRLEEARIIHVKIGYLSSDNSNRKSPNESSLSPHRQSYSWPAKPLASAFQYGLDKINQLYSNLSSAGGQPMAVRFVSKLLETHGDGDVSVKQTIELITKHEVDVIVGPQQNCQLESKLAGVFDIAMISYYCPQWALPSPTPRPPQLISGQPSGEGEQVVAGDLYQVIESRPQTNMTPATFIQTKPPHWKIVERVVTLVAQLLAPIGQQPQQLVLLYFRKSTMATPISSIVRYRSLFADYSSDTEPLSYQPSSSSSLFNDAIQYKLIGELLEIKLNELLASRSPGREPAPGKGTANDRKRVRGLTVLNWSTNFHYGYTENPFLRTIKRHLNRPMAHGTKPPQQCGDASDQEPEQVIGARSTIYIVVGHYYEHLGLMLALDQLNLLAGDRRTLAPQPSVTGGGGDRDGFSVASSGNNRALVVGVDKEHYDSEHLLRGLLMDTATIGDEPTRRQMYRHYVGVAPAQPSREAELLMRSLILQSEQRRQQSQQEVELGPHQVVPEASSSIRLTPGQMLKLRRLPVEAFYLHDSIQLLGQYFAECLQKNGSSLVTCNRGHDVFNWFRNRRYTSCIQNSATQFDDMAQSEGSYDLIGLSDSEFSKDQYDGGYEVAPIGSFIDGGSAIEFHVDWQHLDTSWLPLWCNMKRSNESQCANLYNSSATTTIIRLNEGEASTITISLALIVALVIVALLVVTKLIADRKYLHKAGRCSAGLLASSHNEGWFTVDDEKNFLTIVHTYLAIPRITEQGALEKFDFADKLVAPVDLHCRMFPFPSCKFVHWLSALHQLKEMMFQFQLSNQQQQEVSVNNRWQGGAFSLLASTFCTLKETNCRAKIPKSNIKGREFFVGRHKGTNSIRLLLSKYKSMNEYFCRLARLDHEHVARLLGLCLAPNNYGGVGESKSASLLVEQTGRGNLRQALLHLDSSLEPKQAAAFRQLVARQAIGGLLAGLEYLHASEIQFHGELRATTCALTLDWRLKLSGFHCHHMRRSLGNYVQKLPPLSSMATMRMNMSCTGCDNSSSSDDTVFYLAPEVLENHDRPGGLSVATLRLADVYSFAFVVYELLVGQEPWSCQPAARQTSAKLLVERVKVDSSFRPPLWRLDRLKEPPTPNGGNQGDMDDGAGECDNDGGSPASYAAANSSSSAAAASSSRLRGRGEDVNLSSHLDLAQAQRTIRACWSHSPNKRPQSIKLVRQHLEVKNKHNSSSDVIINRYDIINLLAHYTNLLEEAASNRANQLEAERNRSLALSLRLLPKSVVAQVCRRERVPCRQFDCVSLLAFRFVPLLPDNVSAMAVFDLLNELLVQLDRLVDTYRHCIHLVDSQVDSSLRYLIYAGEILGERRSCQWSHHQLVSSFALQLIDLTNRCQSQQGVSVQVRCGLHCGPLTAGLMLAQQTSNTSSSAPQLGCLARYVLIGPTMNLVDTLETSGLAQRIQISNEFRLKLQQLQLRLPANERVDNEPQRRAGIIGSHGSTLSAPSLGSAQGYVVIRRQTKISSKQFGEFDAYWLLNGPRLSPSQSLTLSS